MCITPAGEQARATAQQALYLGHAREHAELAQPDEMAGAVVYFASPASSFVTGQTLILDGGRIL